MQAARRTDVYCGNQIRLLLGNLNKSAHSVKVKAVKEFHTYIETYEPDIYAENVDILFFGNDEIGEGLMYWAGVSSENHNGQLKRICGPVMELIKYLITMEPPPGEDVNIYRDRFTHYPAEDLAQMNFGMHVIAKSDGKVLKALQLGGGKNNSGQSRQGNTEEAFVVLYTICTEHRTFEDEDDPIDPSYFLGDSKKALDKFDMWQQKTQSESVRTV